MHSTPSIQNHLRLENGTNINSILQSTIWNAPLPEYSNINWCFHRLVCKCDSSLKKQHMDYWARDWSELIAVSSKLILHVIKMCFDTEKNEGRIQITIFYICSMTWRTDISMLKNMVGSLIWGTFGCKAHICRVYKHLANIPQKMFYHLYLINIIVLVNLMNLNNACTTSTSLTRKELLKFRSIEINRNNYKYMYLPVFLIKYKNTDTTRKSSSATGAILEHKEL